MSEKNLSVISDTILSIESVNRTYIDDEDNTVEALRDISLNVQRGEFLTIIGSSGCGKTTLLSFPHQISGGMAQRVAIARALINNPSVLLLDEPMGALDSFTRADIQDKLLELWRSNKTTIILVTHDVDEAIYLSDRIVIMTPRPGKIREIIEVKLPHPRHRGSVDFLSIRRDILEKLHWASANPQPEYII
jgi:NitT/TauT family transport system ATP-binding protein/sulfonate transport system ATP-binding protein